ncbi:hypothetical protein EV641_103390 [Rhodococcus sp. SMB37]|uniref:hypothetical protein n=1 Tax=Rhodococcus sp. SMB37 TaxID=2512213 RepID=UPI00104326B2|nr:hypothetical protein [Rhodococcus sp. SMB37]TCN56042.1 hypothetical protein EV641_103390 [Rhodococcus sp. SMB37]
MSLWSRALSVDELDDRTWLELMPWLDRYGSARTAALNALAPTPSWWESQSPAQTAADTEIPELCAELSRIYVTDHPELRFADGLIRTVEVAVEALDLGVSAATIVARLPHAPTTAELFSRSPADLFDVRGADSDAVYEIVCAALVLTVLRDPSTLGPEESAAPVPALALLVDDLAAVARWRTLCNERDRPLLNIGLDTGAPEEIQEAVARLGAIAARDLPVGAPADPVTELAEYVASLPGAEREILRRRIHDDVDADSSQPSTFPFGTAVGDFLAALRTDVRPVASFDRILRDRPVLAQVVPGLDAPLWKVLDRLDDRCTVADGWIAVPDLAEAEKQTRALLGEFESANGVVQPAGVAAIWQLPADEFESWMQYCGTTMFEGRILTAQGTVAGHAAQILEVIGDPLSAETLVARMDANIDIHSVVEELGDDDRFTVTEDDGLWGLLEWETDLVTAVATRIARLVDGAAGSIELDKVAEALVQRFSISDASARVFAASGDFEVVAECVRRRRRTHVPALPPERTKRLYRLDEHWRLRIPVTRDHMRGAEVPIPSAVAGIVGCEPGAETVLRSRLGPQMLRWTGPVPQLASVRRFLDEIGIDEYGELFLEVRSDGRFDVLPLRTFASNADPLRKALALIGYTTPEVVPEANVPAAFATAIGLDGETRPRRILSAYRARHEAEVVSLLESAWVRVPSGQDRPRL